MADSERDSTGDGGAGFIGSHLVDALVEAERGWWCSTTWRQRRLDNLRHLLGGARRAPSQRVSQPQVIAGERVTVLVGDPCGDDLPGGVGLEPIAGSSPRPAVASPGSAGVGAGRWGTRQPAWR